MGIIKTLAGEVQIVTAPAIEVNKRESTFMDEPTCTWSSVYGLPAKAETMQIPFKDPDGIEYKMSFQHDLVIKMNNDVKMIGSIKTSSKDRIDKIFLDKFIYNQLTGKSTPKIAVFLHDVQRKGKLPKYIVGSTFLPGHFIGYTLQLNPLDGVYYCDIRPNMQTGAILKDHIKTFDHLLIDDIWNLL